MNSRLLLRNILLCWSFISALGWAVAATNMPSVGRILWLKAADLTLKTGDEVTTWADLSVRGRQAVFTKVNGKGSAPTFMEKAFLDQPAVRFAGDSMLRISSLPLGSFTIAIVFKTANSGEMLFQHSDSAKTFEAGQHGCMLTTGETNTFSVKRGGIQSTKNATGEDAAKWASMSNAPVVLIAAFDSNDDSMQVYRNGVPMLLATVAGGLNSRTAVTQAFDIGARAMPGDMQFHGDIAEIVIYDHILPKTAHRLLNNALMLKYIPTPQYTDPSRVNVLEQWNKGSYALGTTSTAGDPIRAVVYSMGGEGWVVGDVNNQANHTVSARFTFPQPLRLARVVLQWRTNNHSPTNYTISDQAGVIISDTNGPYDGVPRDHSFAPRNCEYLEISSNPADTEINVYECDMIRAYLATGEEFPISGMTNILYEEDGKMQVSGAGYDASWYDHSSTAVKPSSQGGNVTFHFSREYELLGAIITQYDSQRYLAKARIEISRDGIKWTTLYSADEYHYRGNAELRNNGYLSWDTPPDTELIARWWRLSWGENDNPVEITEIQLFGRML